MNIEKVLPEVQKNILLAEHTSFKIGGPADYFFQTKTKQNLIKAVESAISLKLPFFILGGGNNVLVNDEGYRGLVIKIKSPGREADSPESCNLKIKSNNSRTEINCGAGVMLKDLVAKTVELELAGLEWAAGIPGTIGGAIRGNAGAFGESIGDSVKEAEVLEISGTPSRADCSGRGPGQVKIKKYSKQECNFKYRSSIFKQKKNLIILSIYFQFEKGDKEKIKKQIQKNIDYRKKNHPLEFPSAGSVFKNFTPSRPAAAGRDGVQQISAAELIDKAGLRGKKIGQAQISEKHSNFIVNLGGAKAKDVKALIDLVRSEVKKKFGIELEEEVEFINI